MQCFTCPSCRLISRSRFRLRLLELQNGRRGLHASPPRREDTAQRNVKSWYWDTQPPNSQNLYAAVHFFKAHRPFREWTADEWRKDGSAAGASLTAPEIAFLGRSNVGKSSLLNSLTYSANLNRVSSKPGATTTMAAWSLAAKDPETGGAVKGWDGDVSSKLTILDMPGYGFGSSADWGNEIVRYMRNRKQLRRAFLLIDSLHGVKPHDLKMMELLRELAVPFQIVASKCDRLPPGTPQTGVASALRSIREHSNLDKHDQPGLGEIIAVGGQGKQKSDKGAQMTTFGRGFGLENLQWAILRATGLDEFAMNKAGYRYRSLPKWSAFQVESTNGLSTAPEQPASDLDPSKDPAVLTDNSSKDAADGKDGATSEPGASSARIFTSDLSLQDFMDEILDHGSKSGGSMSKSSSSMPEFMQPPISNINKPSRGPGASSTFLNRSRAPSASHTQLFRSPKVSDGSNSGNNSDTQIPLEQKLLDLLGRAKDLAGSPKNPMQGKEVFRSSNASSQTLEGRSTLQRALGNRVSRGADAFAAMFEENKPQKNAPGKGVARDMDAFADTLALASIRSKAPGKGVTQGIDAFTEMVEEKTPKKTQPGKGVKRGMGAFEEMLEQKKTQEKPVPGKGVSRGIDAFEEMFEKKKTPEKPVPGKGVSRGIDAFEEMFAEEESRGSKRPWRKKKKN